MFKQRQQRGGKLMSTGRSPDTPHPTIPWQAPSTYRRIDFIQFFVLGDRVVDSLLHVGDVLLIGAVIGGLPSDLDPTRSRQSG